MGFRTKDLVACGDHELAHNWQLQNRDFSNSISTFINWHSYTGTLCFIVLLFIACHRCWVFFLYFFFTNWRQDSTSKKITSCFIAVLALLRWSGPEPAVSLRSNCVKKTSLIINSGYTEIQFILERKEKWRFHSLTLECIGTSNFQSDNAFLWLSPWYYKLVYMY